MSTKQSRAAIYCRASTGEQADSCDSQEESGRKKALALGASVVAVYRDDGISGTRTDRPAYLKMLAAANDKEFDTLIVWKLDRLGRNGHEREKATQRLEFHGTRIVTYGKDYDTNVGALKNRKLNRSLLAAVDEYMVDNLAEDVHRGLESKFQKGHWTGGRVFGYALEPVYSRTALDAYDKPLQTATNLRIHPEQAAIVREMFERYANGASPQRIAADLNERGIPSPGASWKRGDRRTSGWARSAIWAMLQNPLYTGSHYWDRSQWVKMDNRRIRKERDKTELKGKAGNAPHLRIVSDAMWKLVQSRIGVNKLKPGDKRLMSGGKATYLLSGILKCECGARFVLDSATHYRCGKALDGESCDKSNRLRVRRDVAEAVILKPIVDELLAPAMVAKMEAEFRAYFKEVSEAAKGAQASVPAAVAELDARIARLRDRLKTGDPDMSADDLLGVIEKAEAKRTELMADRPEVKHQAKLLKAMPAAAKQYRDQITKGLKGDPAEAGRARIAVRQLLGDTILLKPAKDRSHLVAHLQFQQLALLGRQFAGVGSVGSGGRI